MTLYDKRSELECKGTRVPMYFGFQIHYIGYIDFTNYLIFWLEYSCPKIHCVEPYVFFTLMSDESYY